MSNFPVVELLPNLMIMIPKLKYLAILFLVSIQSCSKCSQESVGSSPLTNTLTETRYSVNRRGWSTLLDVGYPVIPDSIPHKLLVRYCYTVSYDVNTRQPNWVMWQLTDEHVMQKKDDVWNEYREDYEICEMDRATLADYSLSGYDKGHMCPGSDCNWDDKGRDETYLLSNMCPQNPNLNRGDWKEIEMACRKWARQYGSIYIVCGPIFFKSQEHEKIGPNQIPVPEAFFKVVLCKESSNPKGIGFICRNTDGNRKKDFYVNSIRQVERVTGYRFFPNLDDSIKSVVFDTDDINEW